QSRTRSSPCSRGPSRRPRAGPVSGAPSVTSRCSGYDANGPETLQPDAWNSRAIDVRGGPGMPPRRRPGLVRAQGGLAEHGNAGGLISGTLRRIAGVIRTTTTIVLATVKETTVLPLPEEPAAPKRRKEAVS